MASLMERKLRKMVNMRLSPNAFLLKVLDSLFWLQVKSSTQFKKIVDFCGHSLKLLPAFSGYSPSLDIKKAPLVVGASVSLGTGISQDCSAGCYIYTD